MLNKGRLSFKFSVMGAGKTLNIIATYYSYKQSLMQTLILKPGKDSKGLDYIVSRDGSKLKVDFLISDTDDICEKIGYKLLTNNIKCILVDEVQFLKEEHIDQLANIVDYHNIDIICYGLRADFQGNLFPGSKRLFEIADLAQPLELTAKCKCGDTAIMNTRLVDGNFVFEGSQVAIDGEANITYQSLCRKCYKEEKQKYYDKVKVRKLVKE